MSPARGIDATDPSLRSWVGEANDPNGDFPIQNLPYGVVDGFAAVRIGDRALGLRDAHEAGLLSRELSDDPDFTLAIGAPFLNLIAELNADLRSRLRSEIAGLLAEGARARGGVEPLLIDVAESSVELPFAVGDYTDFYASLHHATNVGSMFRPTIRCSRTTSTCRSAITAGQVPSSFRERRSFGRADRPWRATRGRRASARRGCSTMNSRSDSSSGAGNGAGRADRHSRRAEPHLRILPRERLVGARHPEVGVPAARAVPCEELRDDRVAVGRDHRAP